MQVLVPVQYVPDLLRWAAGMDKADTVAKQMDAKIKLWRLSGWAYGRRHLSDDEVANIINPDH